MPGWGGLLEGTTTRMKNPRQARAGTKTEHKGKYEPKVHSRREKRVKPKQSKLQNKCERHTRDWDTTGRRALSLELSKQEDYMPGLTESSQSLQLELSRRCHRTAAPPAVGSLLWMQSRAMHHRVAPPASNNSFRAASRMVLLLPMPAVGMFAKSSRSAFTFLAS